MVRLKSIEEQIREIDREIELVLHENTKAWLEYENKVRELKAEINRLYRERGKLDETDQRR